MGVKRIVKTHAIHHSERERNMSLCNQKTSSRDIYRCTVAEFLAQKGNILTNEHV